MLVPMSRAFSYPAKSGAPARCGRSHALHALHISALLYMVVFLDSSSGNALQTQGIPETADPRAPAWCDGCPLHSRLHTPALESNAGPTASRDMCLHAVLVISSISRPSFLSVWPDPDETNSNF